MKPRLLCILALGFVAASDHRSGDAVEYHFDHSYALIAVTEMRAFIELRAYEHDAILDSKVLSSRYMPPDFEVKDVLLGDDPEFILRTRDGGTGIGETHVAVYGVVGRHIRRFGDFVVERHAQSWPETEYREELSGKVSFPKKNELVYRYNQVLTRHGKGVTNSVTQLYSFNPKKLKYEQKRP